LKLFLKANIFFGSKTFFFNIKFDLRILLKRKLLPQLLP